MTRLRLTFRILALAGSAWGVAVGVVSRPGACRAETEARPAIDPAAQAALQKLNGLIGEWRGVGQPRRQSNRDAWSESTAWAWDFRDGAALVQSVTDGRLAREARLTFDPAAAQYLLRLTAPDGRESVYTGRWSSDQLVLTTAARPGDPSRRITITPRSDIRLVVLHEATEPDRDLFFRVAEIGYTRAGRRLAGPGGGQPQCVVTGGLGTIEVRHAGQTYYVCCTGCKQAFEDDPERILKEYRERLQLERAARGE